MLDLLGHETAVKLFCPPLLTFIYLPPASITFSFHKAVFLSPSAFRSSPFSSVYE